MSSAFPRAGGVLLPLASLPARHGLGDLGASAHDFVDWCAAAGLTWWQMLPVGPLGPGDSPYSSTSAFAGEPLYLSLDLLAQEGLLADADLEAPAALGSGRIDYRRAAAFKRARLARAFEAWKARRAARDRRFDRFCADASSWLDPWAERASDPLEARFLQHRFQVQWRDLRRHARRSGVRFLGDAPIFVGLDSVDVQAHPELFRLDRAGLPKVVTGCPPDPFTPDGQRWGHPHYAWGAHRAEDFRWWRARIGRQLDLFDAVRIDHFIGFHHAYEIPVANAHARVGRWGRTPGRELLEALRTDHPRLPLLAEDLGNATRGVAELRDAFGLPGMKILQWGFHPGSSDAPHRVPENAAVYPGTHDNDTVRGWWRGLDAPTRARVLAATGGTAGSVAWDLWRTACGTAAHTAIAQAQDLLELPGSTRTNVPGKARGNWRWRPDPGALDAHLAARTHDLLDATDRLPRS